MLDFGERQYIKWVKTCLTVYSRIPSALLPCGLLPGIGSRSDRLQGGRAEGKALDKASFKKITLLR